MDDPHHSASTMRRLTPNDFLWSVKLGSQLRVLSYEEPFEYVWSVMSEPGNKRYRKVISCQKGKCVLCKPDVDGKALFWVLDISELENQINSQNLLLNKIPADWYDLKIKV